MPGLDLPDIPIGAFEQYTADQFRALTQPVLDRLQMAPNPAIEAIRNQVAPENRMYVDQAVGAAQRAGIDPVTYLRQIKQESNFVPTAGSNEGAKGIAQFTDATAKGYGIDPYNPGQALDAGARYMATALATNHGDYRLALASYNAGQGNVDRYGQNIFNPAYLKAQGWSDEDANQPAHYIASILGGGAAPTPTPTPASLVQGAGAALGAAAGQVAQVPQQAVQSFKDYSAGLLHQFSQSIAPPAASNAGADSTRPSDLPMPPTAPQAPDLGGSSFHDWSTNLIGQLGQTSSVPPAALSSPGAAVAGAAGGDVAASSPALSSPSPGYNDMVGASSTPPPPMPTPAATGGTPPSTPAPSFADWSTNLINQLGQRLGGGAVSPNAGPSTTPTGGPSYNDMVGANSNGQGGGPPSLTSLDTTPAGIQAPGTPGLPLLPGSTPLTDAVGNVRDAALNQYNNNVATLESATTPRPVGTRPSLADLQQGTATVAPLVLGTLGGDMPAEGGGRLPMGVSAADVSAGASREVAAPELVHAAGITDPNVTYDFRPKVVSLDSLTPSHTDALEPHPDFPAGVQPRERSRAGSMMQIDTMAKSLNPDAMLIDSGQLDRGTPIVGPNNVVESGNGRTLALRRARQDVPDRWAAYQQALRDALPTYGLQASDIAGIKDPVLVRERVTTANPASFAAEANQSAVLGMAPVEQARQDAARLGSSAVEQINVGDGQTIDAALRSPSNLPLIRSFLESVPANERAQIVTADGSLNQNGLVRMKNALFARTFPGAAGQRLAATFLESIDPVLKNVETGIFGALGSLAKSEALAKSGARAPELSLGEDLAKATDVLARLKQEGVPTAHYLAQSSMFVRELTPTQEQILIHLNSLGRSPREIRTFLQDYAQAVEKAPPPAQTSFLGPSTLTKESILDRVIAGQRANLAPDSAPLFRALADERAAEQGRAATNASGPPPIAVPERPATPLASLADRPQLAPEPQPRQRVAPSVTPPPAARVAVPAPTEPAPAPPVPPVRPTSPASTTEPQPLPGMPPARPPTEPRPPPLSGSQPPLGPPGIPSEVPTPNGPNVRAGNILLNKYVSPDVQQVIADAAAKDPQAMEAARRGVVSDATVQQLADAAGTSVQKVIARWKPGDAANAETINAMRGALAAKSNEITTLNKAIAGGDSSPSTLAQFNLAVREQQAIQQSVAGVTAEAGRGLRALRASVTQAVQSGDAGQMQAILKKMGGAEWTQELSDKLAQLDPTDATARYQFLRNAFNPTLKDYLTELWMNAMLSGPHTMAVKTTSETLSLALSPLERLASAAVEAPLATLQGRPIQRFAGEAGADIVGMVGGVREGVAKGLYTMQHGFSQSDVLSTDYVRGRAFKGPVGAVINAPSNLLAAGVEMMHSIAQAGALNAGAYRLAKIEGVSGDALAQRMAELRATPTPTLLKYAQDQGTYRTFQQAPGPLMQKILAVRNADWNGIPVGRILVPFFSTPVNLLKMGMERSPMAALNPSLWRNVAAKNPQAADDIGRWVLGSSIGAALALEVGAGNITGPAPTSATQADAWRREGKTPWSMRIGDKWVGYQRLEPLNQTIGQAATIVNALQGGQDVSNAASAFALTIAANLVSQPYMQSLSTFMAALKDPQKASALFTQGLASSAVPAAVRVVAQDLDPTVRQVTTPLEAAQADIPGLSQQLPARLDAFGQPRERLTSNVSPIGVSQATTDPINQELSRYGVEPGFAGKTLRGIDLTRQELNDHQRISGQAVHDALSQVLANPRYATLNDLQKARALQLAITRAKDRAAQVYVGQLVQQQGRDAILQRIAQKKAQRVPVASGIAS